MIKLARLIANAFHPWQGKFSLTVHLISALCLAINEEGGHLLLCYAVSIDIFVMYVYPMFYDTRRLKFREAQRCWNKCERDSYLAPEAMEKKAFAGTIFTAVFIIIRALLSESHCW